MDPGDTLLVVLGGEDALRGILHDFATRLLSDRDLADLYTDQDAADLGVRLLPVFISVQSALGEGTISRQTHHSDIPRTESQWQRWSGHLMTLLQLRDLESRTLDRVQKLLDEIAPTLDIPRADDA